MVKCSGAVFFLGFLIALPSAAWCALETSTYSDPPVSLGAGIAKDELGTLPSKFYLQLVDSGNCITEVSNQLTLIRCGQPGRAWQRDEIGRIFNDDNKCFTVDSQNKVVLTECEDGVGGLPPASPPTSQLWSFEALDAFGDVKIHSQIDGSCLTTETRDVGSGFLVQECSGRALNMQMWYKGEIQADGLSESEVLSAE